MSLKPQRNMYNDVLVLARSSEQAEVLPAFAALLSTGDGATVKTLSLEKLLRDSGHDAAEDATGARAPAPGLVPALATRLRTHLGRESPDLILCSWSQAAGWNGFIGLLARKLGATLALLNSPADLDFSRLVLATGGGVHAVESLKAGYSISRNTGTPAHVLRITSRHGTSGLGEDMQQRNVKQVREMTHMQLQMLDLDMPLQVISAPDVANALATQVKPGELLILGGTNDWRLNRNFAGSIPDQVVRKVPSSSLVLFSRRSAECRLEDVFWERTVIPQLRVENKWQAIEKLLDILIADEQIPSTEREDVLRTIRRREEENTTATGRGVALPHAALSGFSGTVGAVGVSPEGIAGWHAGNEQVHFIFLIVSPDDDYTSYLSVLSQIAGAMINEEVRQQLLEARTPVELASALHRADDQ